MFSWFLKFFLYTVLSVCLLWSATVLLGPRLLSLASNSLFGHTVTFSGLKITPKLEIYASSLELQNFQIDELGAISGKVRSISIKLLDLFSDNRRAEVSVGPTEINGFGSVQNLSLSLLTSNLFNFQNLKFSAKIKTLKQKDGFSLKNLDFSGEWAPNSEIFQNINFHGVSLALNEQFDVRSESFSGTVSTLGFVGGKLNLDFSTSFLSPEILGRNLKATRLDLSGNIGNKKPELTLKIYQSSHNGTGFYVENADIFLSGPQLSRGIWDFISFDLDTIKPSQSAFISDESTVKNLAGKITKSDQTQTTYELSAKLDYFKLVFNEQILADTSFFDFESAGRVVMDGESMKLDAQMNFTKPEKSQLALNTVFDADISYPISGECEYINCGLRSFHADWMLEASGHSLTGVSDCLLFNCISSRHTLDTNNTGKLFEELIALRIFNPIALSLFYRQMMEGEKVGLGHHLALEIK